MKNVLVNEMNGMEVAMSLRKKMTLEDKWLEFTCFIVNTIEELEFGYTLAYSKWEEYKSGDCFEKETTLYSDDEDSCWNNLWKITGVALEDDEYETLHKRFKTIHYCENYNTLVFELTDNSKFVVFRM
ncbi:hypothetical protein [Clostridium sp. BL-8]|uniref:hypothetical protein n=1 Tax=Clostridium sp. BL-8 TaxID=349938 RepID=UPI00098C8A6D|nr:hypothetical protein [Clostridium sp. BL-8]OOM76601.1 hypothetical protein CLOBL_34860 [Clostridium sp. BL-8]